MTLNELLDGVAAEMEAAGLEPAGASLSLAFAARKQADGTVICEFMDAGAISNPRAEALHRLEVALSDRAGTGADGAFETGGKESEVVAMASDPCSEFDCDDPDTPSIFRIRLAQEEVV